MIYFITKPDGSAIKIGTTIRLTSRLKQLAAQCGEELEVLAVVDGSFDVENELHRRFAHLRQSGEWFEPGDDLTGFIVSDGRPWDGVDDVPPVVSVKIDADVVRKAKIVATKRGEGLAEFLSSTLAAMIDEMLEQAYVNEMKVK